MPITIYRRDSHKNKIAFLCPDSWSIAEQLYALEAWLDSNGKYLEHGDYIADVGIRVRNDFDNGVGG